MGHTGTLDPFASGLLLLCIGRSTRLAEYLQSLDKVYLASARLGVSTTTHDPEGDVVSTSEEWASLTRERIDEELQRFVGATSQRPPDYSAKKIRGTAAYTLARRGESVALEPVEVTVHGIEIEELDLPEVRFRVGCAAGTYIRGLARDLGERLGVGAYLTSLRRVAIGPFRVEEALPPQALSDRARVEQSIISPLDAVGHLPRVEVTTEEAERLITGQSLEMGDRGSSDSDGDHAVVLDSRLLAVAVRSGTRIRPKKVFSFD